ncbi:MAG: monofunctional biosynthetic peptidoglycan transglycosylase [Burkholderiales bacterium]|nr:monofunctional biosynthetic peptidoglycan transglycosylase [Burkholderiales bacterium]
MFRILWRSVLFLLGVALGILLVYELWVFGHVWWWVEHNPSRTAFMQQHLERAHEDNPNAELRQRWVPYARISRHLKRAVVAAEDAKFLDHEGFDWEAIQQAHAKNMRRGRVVAGGSTISQQLAKNLFLSGDRSALRKAQEAIATVMLEAMMDKRRILEIYLNVIEWGNGVFGAEAAARHYYGVSAAQLSAEQAARLASMVPNPRFYDRHRHASWLNTKTRIILGRMGAAQVP